jgi:hypothetical protein
VTDPRTLFFTFAASFIALSLSAAGDDWPQFRGPGGRGFTLIFRGRNSLFAVSRPDP